MTRDDRQPAAVLPGFGMKPEVVKPHSKETTMQFAQALLARFRTKSAAQPDVFEQRLISLQYCPVGAAKWPLFRNRRSRLAI
ncbi:MAG TPA: hypothetical protein VGA75_02225 [Paracoccaceae bacterium]